MPTTSEPMATSELRPLRVAVVGAGPAGMYAAGHLLGSPGGTYLDGRMADLAPGHVEVDVLERLPTPWGLVRGGVAPDHPDKKLIARVFESIAARPGFRFFGNVEVGRDITPAELTDSYDAVIYAVGASSDRHLEIPGERLPGCWSAREFVAWYNGHPDYADLEPDLSGERAVVIGNGNVALDVARILTLSAEHLATTDIADHALQALRGSAIREVQILGRRGYLQAAFHNPELEELTRLPGVDLVVELDDLMDAEEASWTTRRKLETLRRHSVPETQEGTKRIVLRFLSSPVEVVGRDQVEAVRVVGNQLERDPRGTWQAKATGEESVIPAGLVLKAVGYTGAPIPGLPFDEQAGVIPSRDGRVTGHDGTYVAGWIKRGPHGIIGTNKKCARDTVLSVLEDAAARRLPTRKTLSGDAIADLLSTRHPDVLTYQGWKAIDRYERRAGRTAQRSRVKLASVSDMLEVAREHAASGGRRLR